MEGNTCDRCGKEVFTEFTVDNSVWQAVTGHAPDSDGTYADGYLCMSCFVALAEERLKDADITCTLHVRKDRDCDCNGECPPSCPNSEFYDGHTGYEG